MTAAQDVTWGELVDASRGEGARLDGRALDVSVAEKVMGWKRTGDDDHTKPGHDEFGGSSWERKGPHPRLVAPDGSGSYYLCPCNEGVGWWKDAIHLPVYSTDIAAAWQVVERMRARGWRCEFFSVEYGDGWMASFFKATIPSKRWRGDTLPEAVALAALAAVRAAGEGA